MRKLKLNAGDYEYLDGSRQYIYELEPHALVSLKANASEIFDVLLVSPEENVFPLWSGTFCNFEIQSAGFASSGS